MPIEFYSGNESSVSIGFRERYERICHTRRWSAPLLPFNFSVRIHQLCELNERELVYIIWTLFNITYTIIVATCMYCKYNNEKRFINSKLAWWIAADKNALNNEQFMANKQKKMKQKRVSSRQIIRIYCILCVM